MAACSIERFGKQKVQVMSNSDINEAVVFRKCRKGEATVNNIEFIPHMFQHFYKPFDRIYLGYLSILKVQI
jgi:hypothetical protein